MHKMTSRKKNVYLWYGIGALVFVLVIAGMLSRRIDPNEIVRGTNISGKSLDTWLETDIECVDGSHESIPAESIMTVNITVNGEPEPIPANIGQASYCLAELHTGEDGKIHIAANDSGRVFTLEEFLAMIERSVERPGMELYATVNDRVTERPGETILADGQTITLAYTYDPTTPVMVPSDDGLGTVPFTPN